MFAHHTTSVAEARFVAASREAGFPLTPHFVRVMLVRCTAAKLWLWHGFRPVFCHTSEVTFRRVHQQVGSPLAFSVAAQGKRGLESAGRPIPGSVDH